MLNYSYFIQNNAFNNVCKIGICKTVVPRAGSLRQGKEIVKLMDILGSLRQGEGDCKTNRQVKFQLDVLVTLWT